MGNRLYFILRNEKALEYAAANGGPSNLGLLSTWDDRSDAPKMPKFWKNF